MEREKLISTIKNRPFVLFGASQAAVNFCDSYPFLDLDYFWDNAKEKSGTIFLEKEVFSPKQKDSFEKDIPFIVITSMYIEEITSQLETLGFIEGIDFISFEMFNRIIGKGQFFPPGHYYSPVPDILDIQKTRYFERTPELITGIDLDVEEQKKMFMNLKKHILQFREDYSSNKFKRFYLKNNFFGEFDAAILYSMIMHEKPKRIIEVGSGFSSALMMDVRNLYQMDEMEFYFIEPHPERLESLMEINDYKTVTINKEKVQFIDINIFTKLEKGDILFIDSSHVSKIGSDVNFLIFEVLPRLKPGIIIHFHDIFYPFEYPQKWIYEGRFWNEAYILRAFLQYNHEFQIEIWNHYLSLKHRDIFEGTLNDLSGGGSLWLRKK